MWEQYKCWQEHVDDHWYIKTDTVLSINYLIIFLSLIILLLLKIFLKSEIKNNKLLNENGYLIGEVLLKKSFLVSIEVFCLSSYEATTNHEVWLHYKNQKYAAIENHIFIYGIWPVFYTFKFAWICNALSHFISTYQPLSPKNQRSSTKVE